MEGYSLKTFFEKLGLKGEESFEDYQVKKVVVHSKNMGWTFFWRGNGFPLKTTSNFISIR